MLNMILRCNPTNLNTANTHRQPLTGIQGYTADACSCQRVTSVGPPDSERPVPAYPSPPAVAPPQPRRPPHTRAHVHLPHPAATSHLLFSFFPPQPHPQRSMTPRPHHLVGPTCHPSQVWARTRAAHYFLFFFCAGPTMLATGGGGAQAVLLPTATLHFTVGPTRTVSPPAPPLPRSGPTPTDVWAPVTSPGPLSASGCWGLFVWGSGCWGALQIIFFSHFFWASMPVIIVSLSPAQWWARPLIISALFFRFFFVFVLPFFDRQK